ncbi:hypothetical protein H8S20_16905 [Clostridium sp. NSJ-6]|uniref:Uncharacterized protein n=1 Tax=Clostridium hominis TaxID=2763036 RepID=A0ABR7DGQ1_9CLOT|nr:hypothetical protein [Clostridium hominis]MBC5630538.1 hypothetical protein [Clostridium hominis]
MNFEKIKEMLKNRKVQIIAGTVAGVLVLTLAGTMLLNNKNVENKNIAIEKDNKKYNKKDVNKDNRYAKEKLEELKKTDTSNLSDEEKKDLENKIAEAEKKVADDNNSSSTEEVTSGTSNSDSNSTSSKNDSTENNSTNNNTNNGTVPNKPNDNNTSDSNKHTHSWNPITSTVHHEEQGHYENILVSESWTEEIPIYEEQAREICNGCGADITADPTTHNKNHMLNGEPGGWTTEYVQVQVGTDKINHDAVYENKWVVDKAAWDETVTTGYSCSCGATK